ncbi:type II secretion system protein [bacterium]|nr:type II secretion system protein [bacterium]
MTTMRHNRGFTLIETIVAVALFSIVMLVGTSALLSLVSANRKAQALQSVMNNLNTGVDGMVRAIRMGSAIRCGGPSPTDPNCPNGGSVIYFESYGGNKSSTLDDWMYSYNAAQRRLERSQQNGSNPLAITAPEISIDSCTFYVVGATRGDITQPKVLIVIKGTVAASDPRFRTSFTLQATAVQRSLDI